MFVRLGGCVSLRLPNDRAAGSKCARKEFGQSRGVCDERLCSSDFEHHQQWRRDATAASAIADRHGLAGKTSHVKVQYGDRSSKPT